MGSNGQGSANPSWPEDVHNGSGWHSVPRTWNKRENRCGIPQSPTSVEVAKHLGSRLEHTERGVMVGYWLSLEQDDCSFDAIAFFPKNREQHRANDCDITVCDNSSPIESGVEKSVLLAVAWYPA
ncbi:hypothetical protein NA57DRAFT_51959 [Rhizodiscina lignyota]|uniref:Uncharacterized protein n=1 Tax=Rhizodiscina lignyota TaxID=1504668 RepID=A0A9P4ILY9_9PEZI|nr:hypothetical protein NA57DRAFT_51959 [Rhizodiscina lignyota]